MSDGERKNSMSYLGRDSWDHHGFVKEHSPLQMVVLDAMGVIYTSGDDVADLLIPFVRKHGCQFSDADITSLYHQCSLGRYSSGALWQRLGLKGNPDELDESYLHQHTLMPGLRSFLQTLRTWDMPIACLSNDVAEWSRRLRQKHALEGAIAPWIISGEVGIRKPDPGIYEYCLSMLQIPPQACLFLDDRLPNLEAARSLGFCTAWFQPGVSISNSSTHPLLTSFQEVERWLRERDEREHADGTNLSLDGPR
jgi:HAD superfamily hydrolase (TIGR01509 family)